jgi:hypothetical protein
MRSGPLKDIIAPSRTYQGIDSEALRAAMTLVQRGPFAMGVRMFSCFTNTLIGPLPANATDTIVLTTPPVSPAIDNGQVIILGFVNMTAGASVTSHVFRLRRGTAVNSTAFPLSPWTNTTTAGSGSVTPIIYQDAPGVVAGQQYTLTMVQTAATGVGTWQDGCLLAIVL